MFLFFLVTQVVTDFSRIQHFISLFFLFISCFCALKIITHRNISITATLHICILVCFIIFFFYVHLQRDFFLSLNTTARNLLHYFPFFYYYYYFSITRETISCAQRRKNKENTEKHNRRDKKRVSTIFAENLLHYSLHALERKQHFQSSLYFDLSAAISGKQFKC